MEKYPANLRREKSWPNFSGKLDWRSLRRPTGPTVHLESLESSESLCRISNPTIGGRTDRTVLEDYVGHLSCGEVRGLYQRYLPDFVMFQYGINHILDMTNKGHGC